MLGIGLSVLWLVSPSVLAGCARLRRKLSGQFSGPGKCPENSFCRRLKPDCWGAKLVNRAWRAAGGGEGSRLGSCWGPKTAQRPLFAFLGAQGCWGSGQAGRRGVAKGALWATFGAPKLPREFLVLPCASSGVQGIGLGVLGLVSQSGLAGGVLLRRNLSGHLPGPENCPENSVCRC